MFNLPNGCHVNGNHIDYFQSSNKAARKLVHKTVHKAAVINSRF